MLACFFNSFQYHNSVIIKGIIMFLTMEVVASYKSLFRDVVKLLSQYFLYSSLDSSLAADQLTFGLDLNCSVARFKLPTLNLAYITE